MLVAATNPCPCGFAGVDDRCSCGEADLRRHRRRLSGPLLDRMDMLVDVRRPSDADLRARPHTSSADALARVTEARERQRRRLAGTGAACNGEMGGEMMGSTLGLDGCAEAELGHAYKIGELSARGRHRVLRVARTIADLDGGERVTRADVLLALSLRQRAGVEVPALP
jgi:magnesium chelatase family protein